MPLVSIIMPVYNSSKYVISAIESVFSQSYKDYELIIINDGSTDNSKELIIDYLKQNKDKDVKYIYQENKGASAARNKGIELAKGEYIAFLDADDLWMPEKLSRSINYINSQEYPTVYSDMYIIDSGGNIIDQWFKMKKEISEGNIYGDLLKECFIVPTNIIIRKACLLENKFDETIRGVEDIDLWLRLARKYNFRVIKEPLTKWRNHEGNYSKNSRIVSENIVNVFERELKEWTRKDKYHKVIINILSTKLYISGRYYLKEQKYKQARWVFIKSILYNPNIASLTRLVATILPNRMIKQIVSIRNKG